MDFQEWVRQVRLDTLTEKYGPEQAERLMERQRSLVPDERHPGSSATRMEADWQRWDQRDESILLGRRPVEGARRRVKSEEERARDAGLSVEQWRRLAR
jgi:hypothetical protein